MKPIATIPPCGLMPSPAETPVAVYAACDPTGSERNGWWSFNRLMQKIPYIFVIPNAPTVGGIAGFMSEWITDFITEDRFINWELAIIECARYMRIMFERFDHVEKPTGYVLEDATLQYLQSSSLLRIHLCQSRDFKELSYIGGYLGDYVYTEFGKRIGHIRETAANWTGVSDSVQCHLYRACISRLHSDDLDPYLIYSHYGEDKMGDIVENAITLAFFHRRWDVIADITCNLVWQMSAWDLHYIVNKNVEYEAEWAPVTQERFKQFWNERMLRLTTMKVAPPQDVPLIIDDTPAPAGTAMLNPALLQCLEGAIDHDDTGDKFAMSSAGPNPEDEDDERNARAFVPPPPTVHTGKRHLPVFVPLPTHVDVASLTSTDRGISALAYMTSLVGPNSTPAGREVYTVYWL